MLDWTYEDAARISGFRQICGIDEAGRGPLAGPVYAAAVILPEDCEIAGLDDSKKLTEKKRARLYEEICNKAIAYCISWVDEKVIDEINILNATFSAMQRAVEGLGVPADFALVDGNRSKGLNIPFRCVIGGDAQSPSIAAASILAKVSRDRMITEAAKEYPVYGFEKHKGYGTKAHYDALTENGPCRIHRQSFLKKFYAEHPEVHR